MYEDLSNRRYCYFGIANIRLKNIFMLWHNVDDTVCSKAAFVCYEFLISIHSKNYLFLFHMMDYRWRSIVALIEYQMWILRYVDTYRLCIKGVTEDAGRIGLVIVISGMAGSMVCGIILDKTHKYKVDRYTEW